MNNLIVHKTIILRDIIAMLQDEGVTISTSTAIEMEKALARLNYEYGNDLASLKYYLSPLISRNKEDQENIHRIFDKLDEKAGTGYVDKHGYKKLIQHGPPLQPPQPPQPQPPPAWKKMLKIAVPVVFLAVLLSIFWNKISPTRTPPPLDLIIYYEQAVVNEPVNFSSSVNDSVAGKKYAVDWQFDDTLIRDSRIAQKIFSAPGSQTVRAYLKDESGKQVAADTLSFPVNCEKNPYVSIKKISGQGSGQKNKYGASFINASKDSGKYRYKWYADDKLISEKPALENIRQFNTIKLVVNFDKGVHCSTDSLTATLTALPSISASVAGDGTFTPPSKIYNWKNILYSLLMLILAPLLPAYLIYKLVSNFFRGKKEEVRKKIKPKEGPYKIEFLSQEYLIGSEPGVEKLSDLLRKRQVSEIHRLNIRKTINATLAMGGIPSLQYVPLTKPTSFLVFIDKEYPDSHLIKLFEWLVARLQKEQVDITIYEYYKEPLYLNNVKLNQLRLPIERVAALYPGSTLFIFGDARHFVYPLKGQLKRWAIDKFNHWDAKILVTPFARNDWDKKELALTEAGFIIVPADLSARLVIENVINRHIESHAQEKHPAPAAYPARFINFRQFETLKEYLDDETLLRWVCSLAVFPSVDWNLTIAMGKAIENDLNAKGGTADLVNYTNLLKIGRIAWMHNEIMPDSLKVRMLEHLDNPGELLARQTLLQQLALIKASMPVTDASLIKREMDGHEKMNEFLLKSYAGQTVTKEEKAFIRGIIKEHDIDEAQGIYLNRGRNTLLRHPFRKKSHVGLDRYFELNVLRDKIVPLAAGLFSYFFIAVLSSFLISENTSLFDWTKPGTRDLSFSIKAPGGAIQYLYTTINAGDSGRGFVMANKDTVIEMNGLTITDTSQLGNFTLTSSSEEKAADVFFKLNADKYSVNITKVEPLPLTIYYNNDAALALANAIEQNLPSNYTVLVAKQAFRDTTMRIYFADDSLKDDAQSLAALAAAASGSREVRQINADSTDVYVSAGGLLMYVAAPETCRPLGINALPSSLNEIWAGGTSRRFINVNLPSRIIYYSNDNAKSFVKYSINDICFTGSGAYKIIASDNNRRYKLFFFRNVKQQSFELSVCQGSTNTKEELQNKDESNCDRFNTMSWYYEDNPGYIYLPVGTANLSTREKQKLASKADSLQNNQSISKHSIQLFTSSYTSQVSENSIKQFLDSGKFPFAVSRGNALLYFTSSAIPSNQTPFTRSYLVIKFERDETPKGPDCSVTFTLTSAASVANSVICKLDLSKENLTAIPKEVFGYTNLQELNLGTTKIPQSEIDGFQKQLPNCKIIYTIANPTPNVPQQNQEAQTQTQRETELGYLGFDAKGSSLDKESYVLLERIANQMKQNPSARIRFETSEQGNKIYMPVIESQFKRLRINSSQVEIKDVRGLPPGSKPVRVIGINFPEDDAKSAK